MKTGIILIFIFLRLRVQALPICDDDPNCIEMTPERAKEIVNLRDEVTSFINELSDKYEDIDVTEIVMNFENHSVDEHEEKETILKFIINDCKDSKHYEEHYNDDIDISQNEDDDAKDQNNDSKYEKVSKNEDENKILNSNESANNDKESRRNERDSKIGATISGKESTYKHKVVESKHTIATKNGDKTNDNREQYTELNPNGKHDNIFIYAPKIDASHFEMGNIHDYYSPQSFDSFLRMLMIRDQAIFYPSYLPRYIADIQNFHDNMPDIDSNQDYTSEFGVFDPYRIIRPKLCSVKNALGLKSKNQPAASDLKDRKNGV